MATSGEQEPGIVAKTGDALQMQVEWDLSVTARGELLVSATISAQALSATATELVLPAQASLDMARAVLQAQGWTISPIQ